MACGFMTNRNWPVKVPHYPGTTTAETTQKHYVSPLNVSSSLLLPSLHRIYKPVFEIYFCQKTNKAPRVIHANV